jgi:hypothetical protein
MDKCFVHGTFSFPFLNDEGVLMSQYHVRETIDNVTSEYNITS